MTDDKKKLPDGAEPVKERPADDPAARAYFATDENGRDVIRIDPPEDDPTLNPESPDFDREKWEEYQRQARESLREAAERMKATMSATVFSSIDMNTTVKQMQASLQGIVKTAGSAFAAFQEYFQSDEWKKTRETLELIAETAPAWLEFAKEVEELTPYLEAELKKPEYGGRTIDDLLNSAETDDSGSPLETSLFMQALAKARAARDAAEEEKKLPQITYKDSKQVKTTTDKFANLFFSLAAPQSKGMINGQRQFIPVKYEGYGEKKEITLFYDYSYNENIIKRFGLSKNFDDYCFFVASIIDNLYDEGNLTVSLTKVWHELGNSGSPSTESLTSLVNILRLGMSTIVTADISEVFSAWEVAKAGAITTKELISPVIPVQIAQEKFAANGKTASAVINITGHTPFYIIGYPIDHYTTWSKEVLKLYKGRRTKRYYSVLRFLMTQIGWMRNKTSKRSNKITYDFLYDHTGDKTTRTRQLSRDMMYRLLDEVFIPAGYVSAYKEDSTNGKPGVKLTCTKPPQITKKK